MNEIQQGLVVCTGTFCLLAFALNAALIVWLIIKRREAMLMKCPRCGRQVVCPHCAAEE